MKQKTFILVFMMILPSLSFAAVDLLNGGYVYRLQVTANAKDGQAVSFTIQYRSRSVWSTNIGFGWCSDWTTQLESLGERRYRLRDCGGDLLFTDQNSPTGEGERLTSRQGDELRNGPEGIWVFRRDGARMRFSRQGLLQQRWIDNKVEKFVYDGFDRLREWQRSDQTVLFSYLGVQREARAIKLIGGQPVKLIQRMGNLEMVEMNGPIMMFEYDDLNNLTVIREGRLERERIQYLREQDLVQSIKTAALQLDLKYQPNHDGGFAVLEIQRQIGNQRLIYTYQNSGLLNRIQRLVLSEKQQPIAKEQTYFNYSADQQLRSVVTTNGQLIELNYDESGRFQSLSTPQKVGDEFSAASALQGALEQLAPLKGEMVL